PFAVLVDQVLALFPKVEGEVLEVHGKEVTLSIGRRDGLQAGIELSLYREGRELRHPKTGEFLGRAEQALGRVSVAQVHEAYSVATLAQGAEARAGDRVRLSAGKIRLTLLPLSGGERQNQVEAAVQELVDGLGRTGRFQVLMGDQVGVWLAEQKIKAEEAIEGKGLDAAAKRFKVEQLLAVLFKRIQGKPYMEVRLYSYPAAAPLLSTAMFVPPSVKPQGKGQFSSDPQARPSPPPKQRSFLARLLGGELEAGAYSTGEASIPLKEAARFAFPVISMDVAVAPKDKVPRLVITDGERVYLYRVVNRALEADWTYSARSLGKIFSVQLADLNGDGVLEVVVNRYSHHENVAFTSFILTTRDGKPAIVADNLGDILLAVDATGEGIKQTLWIQPFTPDGVFQQGRVLRAAPRGGSLDVSGPVRVPYNFRATGATLSNVAGKDTRALAYIDEQGRLGLALDGQETWRSSTRVGGGGYLRMEVVKPIERGSRSFFYSMEPMPLAVDLDGDGIEEIVVPQNQWEGFLAVIFRGPAGYRMQSINSGFEGSITGLGAIPGDTPPTLIASVVRFSGLMKSAGETQIIMTTGE
ncbi:MAG: hypothetical protein HYY64_15480, partial [Candidatus Rokubacteria bacterium]|nr:hypothetical protein [Candidatus Rokubacteria bacterium]